MVITKHKKLNISVDFYIFALSVSNYSETLIIQALVVSITIETTIKNSLKTTIV